MAYENVDGNQSPYYVRYIRNATSTDNDPRMSDLVFTYFRSYKDPRLPLYYDSVPNVANRYLVTDTLPSTLDDSLRIVTYRIPYFGLPQSTARTAWLGHHRPGWRSQYQQSLQCKEDRRFRCGKTFHPSFIWRSDVHESRSENYWALAAQKQRKNITPQASMPTSLYGVLPVPPHRTIKIRMA